MISQAASSVNTFVAVTVTNMAATNSSSAKRR